MKWMIARSAAAAVAVIGMGVLSVPAAHAETVVEPTAATEENNWTPFCAQNVFSKVYDTELSQVTQCRIQGAPALLLSNGRYRYAGIVDGEMGPASWTGFQAWLRSYGYEGPIDGVPGTNTYRAVQEYARSAGFYNGPIDGVMGPNSWRGLNKALWQDFFRNE